MFNGNLSEGTTVRIEGCAITPFVTVIKSLYTPDGHLGCVIAENQLSIIYPLPFCRQVEDVYHLVEMYNVVEKYDISSLKAVIVKLMHNLKVKTTNLADILNAISKLRDML